MRIPNPFLILTTILVYSCNQKESASDCPGASSPVDLTLANDCNGNSIVKLYERNGTNDFRLIKLVEVEANKNLTTCLENEGPIEKGLYLRTGNKTKMIKLKYGEEFRLNLCDTTFQVEDIKALD